MTSGDRFLRFIATAASCWAAWACVGAMCWVGPDSGVEAWAEPPPKSTASQDPIRQNEMKRYGGGQRGRIYSDDIEAVRRDQRATITTVRDMKNQRPAATDRNKLNANAEKLLEIRKLKSQVRQLNEFVVDRNNELRDLEKKLERLSTDGADPEWRVSFERDSKKRESEQAQASYERVDQEWRTGTNYACDDFLTYEECQCAAGAFRKRQKLDELNEAERKRNEAAEAYQAAQQDYERSRREATEQAQKEATKKKSETAALVQETQEKLKGANQRIKELEEETKTLMQAPPASSGPKARQKIVYDESAPPPRPEEFSTKRRDP